MVEAADDLASTVQLRLRGEIKHYELNQPDPLRLRWTDSGVHGLGKTTQHRLTRRLDAIVDHFRKLSRQHLIVIGEPGSGKSISVLLLSNELLSRRESGSPVPVLLPISSWDPSNHIDRWLIDQLAEGYFGGSPETPTKLLARGMVLPVLDGLDEIPPARRQQAFTELARSFAADEPVILTCRTDEFRQTYRATGNPFGDAAIIELEPVTPPEAVSYIESAMLPTDTRWQHVFEHLRTTPQGPLAAALSTPLMVWLVKRIYAVPESKPEELIDGTPLPTRRAIEQHLLARFIDAAYDDRPASPLAERSRPGTAEWSATDARRYLTFLAGHLAQRGGIGGDVNWWDLIRSVPPAAAAALSALSFTVYFLPTAAVVVAAVTVPVHGLESGLVSGLVFGVAGAPAAGIGFGMASGTVGVPTPRVTRIGLAKRMPPVRSLVTQATTFLVVATLLDGWLIGLLYGVVGLILITLWEITEVRADEVDIGLATEALEDDRTVVIVRSLAFFVGVAALGLLASDPADAAVAGLGAGFAGGVVSGFGTKAWGRFTVARMWLFLRRQLPWRVIYFLDDAYERRVLRRVGPTYQFRHAELQSQLLASGPQRHTDSEGPESGPGTAVSGPAHPTHR